MDVLAGEEGYDLCEYIFQELESFFFGAIYVFEYSPLGSRFEGAWRAGQFGICRQCRQRVPRQFYFRDDRNVPLGGVAHYLAHFVLGVITAVALAVELVRLVAVVTHEGFLSPGGNFLEFGIFFDLDAPALVFGEVPVEAVELVHGQQVDVALDELHRKKMPPYIQVHAAVRKSRRVLDKHGRHRPTQLLGAAAGRFKRCRQQLPQGLHCEKSARRRACLYGYFCLADFQPVSLFTRDTLVEYEFNFIAGRRFRGD